MGEFWRYLVGMAVGSAWVFSANCVTAQITPDRTLPNNSNVTINGSTFNITGGTQARHNLFHSFQQFSVPTGGKAIFNNGLDIQNIFNRVTGRSASSIDGTIQANGTANVFFLNPSGIVFGKNASLNIGGSFVATTANAIQFGNLGTFSASEPNNPALLTVNPSALLYKQIASVASIQNNSIASAQKDPAGFDAFGLQVPDGKSLLLVGGNISMNGGQLNAYGGRVELGGLASSGTVGIQVNGNDLSLSFPDNITRSDVSLTHGASVSVQAAGGGSITVNASDLNITGGSQLVAGIEQGLGSIGAKAGDITLNATGDIKIDGSGSYIFNNVEQQAIGNGGNISLSSNTFELTGGGQIQAVILGKGSPADVVINTNKSVSLDGKTTGDGRTTGVVTGVGAFNDTQNNLAIGKGGNIEIKTDQLLLTNGSQLNVNTFGQGNAGNITLNVSSLSLANGAQLQAISHGQGNAGSIIINATKNVFLDGSSIFTSIGSVNSTLNNLAMGKGGNIQITTNQLSLTNDAGLTTSTNGAGDAGNVIIKANKSVALDNSGILSTAGDVSLSPQKNSIVRGNGGKHQHYYWSTFSYQRWSTRS
jgi:filamentous hemagglutinin family protein